MRRAVDVQAEFEQLPPEEQKEVLDFIAFLRGRGGRRPLRTRARSIPIEKDPFVGIWAGREDMKESARWVGDTRKRKWDERSRRRHGISCARIG